jgi:hypothetical protein
MPPCGVAAKRLIHRSSREFCLHCGSEAPKHLQAVCIPHKAYAFVEPGAEH